MGFSLSLNSETVVTFIYMFKECIANALLVYIFPFFQVNARHSLGLMEFIVVSDRV